MLYFYETLISDSAYKEETRRLIADSLTDMYDASQHTERRRSGETGRRPDSIRDPLEESVLSENERQLFQDATLQYILEPDDFLNSIGSGNSSVTDEIQSDFYDPRSFCNDISDSFNPSLDLFEEQHRLGQSRHNESFPGKRVSFVTYF